MCVMGGTKNEQIKHLVSEILILSLYQYQVLLFALCSTLYIILYIKRVNIFSNKSFSGSGLWCSGCYCSW